MYAVFKNDKLIGEGTLSECLHEIGSELDFLDPGQVTVTEAIAAGYQITRI